MLRTRRLQSYLLGELVIPTLLGLALYTFTLLMNEFFLVARDAVAKDLGWDVVLRLFAYQIPKVFVMTIPMATLLGTMIGIGRLSADQEWVALQAAGLGPGFLLQPVLTHGILAFLMALLVYLDAVPAANYASRALTGEIMAQTSLVSEIRPRVFYDDLPGTVLFVDEIRREGEGRLLDILIYQAPEKPGGAEKLILARRGDLYPVPDGSGMLELDLRDGILHSFRSGAAQSYIVSTFGTYVLRFKPPDYLRSLRNAPDRTVADMGPGEILHEIAAARADKDVVFKKYRERRVWVEFHQRLALPAACVLFALLSMPLGITRARTGKGAGFALSTAVVFVYWLVFTVTRNMAARGRVPAGVGVWAANALIALAIVWAFWRMPAVGRDSPSVWMRLRELASFLARSRPAVRNGDVRARAAYDGAGVRLRFPGLVDRYVIAQYLRIVALALASGYLIYTVVEVKRLLDGVLQNRQPGMLVGRYLKYFAPGMLQFTLPVACLVAGVVTFTILGRRGELTALKAGGMSMRRALLPVVAVTAALCALLFLVQDRIAPVSNRKAQEVRDQILGRAPRSYGLPVGGGRWTFGAEGRLYQYRLYDSDRRTFQGLSIFRVDRSGPRVLDHTYAASAHWNGTAWEMAKGWRREFPAGGGVGPWITHEGTWVEALDPPENFSRRETTLALGTDLPEQMSIEELGEQLASLENSGYDTTRLRVGYWAKFSLPFTPLVMLLLGLPFAFKVGRSGSLYAIGISLLLVILYWATLAVFNALGLETILPPLLAAWAPNVLYGILGTYLLLFVKT
jgi:LPS export ABC transporter permease LptG/LPS export ABC transporter permease LptF